MNDLFLKIINMSISASWLVLAVLLLRFVLKKAPKWVNVLLWGIVAVRLAFPFSIESALSLIPSAETVPLDIEMAVQTTINSGVPVINSMVNPMLSSFAPPQDVLTSANPLQIWIPILSIVWVAGVVALLLYTSVSYWRLRHKVSEAVILRDNIFQSENVASPFVLGVFRPRIYLPYNMDGQDLSHVVAHEQAHIRRRDHWWKPLGFLLLTIHWFNPLMWLAYVLLCRDIELACDEKVIKELGNEQRADYTQALVACSVNRRMIAACPLAFGEVGVKERVKSVMNYKKPAFWVIVLAVIACAVVAVCFLTNPKTDDIPDSAEDGYFLLISVDGVESIKITGINTGGGVVNADGSAFENGEKVWLEPLQGVTDLRGYSITALGKNGEILYALSIPEGATNDEVVNLVGSDGWLLAPTDFGVGLAGIAGKTYLYEGEGIMGSFTITLYDDGTFTYYEGMASSYIGVGSWEQEGDTITMTDDGHGGYGLVNHFKLDGDDLVFVDKDSANFVYVKVQNGEKFHCTGEAFKQNDGSDGSVQIMPSQKLSLNDVIMLSQKGYELSWSDFEQFKYIETGSGLYIRVYEINEMYELWIGGGWTDEDPMYIYLALADDLDTRIDIRDGGVTEFISKTSSKTYDRLLAQEEIDQVNAAFSPIVYDKQGNPIATNVWSCFFTSYYSDVRNMNFAEFLAYFPGDGSTVDEEEFSVLKEHPDFLFYGEVSTLANMPVPVHRYPVRIIDLVLKEYAGITVDDLDISGVVYLAEYDAFYNHTSDAGGGMFYCTRGEIDGDIVRLYEEFDYGTDMLTLKKVGNNYQIVAHQHVEG